MQLDPQWLHIETIILRWYDLLGLAVCRRVLSSLQMLRGNGERE